MKFQPLRVHVCYYCTVISSKYSPYKQPVFPTLTVFLSPLVLWYLYFWVNITMQPLIYMWTLHSLLCYAHQRRACFCINNQLLKEEISPITIERCTHQWVKDEKLRHSLLLILFRRIIVLGSLLELMTYQGFVPVSGTRRRFCVEYGFKYNQKPCDYFHNICAMISPVSKFMVSE